MKLVLLALCCGIAACNSPSSPRADPAPCRVPADTALEKSRARYPQALAAARNWLDGLKVDPLELRRLGIKGKKKLTEQLDAYYHLWQVAEPPAKSDILQRISEVVTITYDPAYHDLAGVDDKSFKEDATSYLRTAILMERLGFNITGYRAEIAKIHPRLNAQMAQRGPHQRLAFHWYYQHFGLQEPFALQEAVQEGLIRRRAQPSTLSIYQVYQLTHEVLVPYEYGDRLDVDPFSAAEKEYLRSSLEALLPRSIARCDPDLTGELVTCMRLLKFVDRPAYREGLAYLSESQHPDGSWGNLERAKAAFGEYDQYGQILHTTLVAIETLTLAFHPAWNPPAAETQTVSP